jgi:hypothetical protein
VTGRDEKSHWRCRLLTAQDPKFSEPLPQGQGLSSIWIDVGVMQPWCTFQWPSEVEIKFILRERRHILQVLPNSGSTSHAANINCGWSLLALSVQGCNYREGTRSPDSHNYLRDWHHTALMCDVPLSILSAFRIIPWKSPTKERGFKLADAGPIETGTLQEKR